MRVSFRRQDGLGKVTGDARYVADLSVAGMLHGAFRAAGTSHARILGVDTTPALEFPGVHAVITADDVPEHRHGAFVRDRALFARDVVRWEGEVIAAVAAESPQIARAAAQRIKVDVEPLPPVIDLAATGLPDTTLIHEGWPEYEAHDDVVRHGNVASRSTIVKGDVEKAMAQAGLVVTDRFVADGSHAVPIEPRAMLAEWHADRVTIWSSTQVPFAVRTGVAEALGLRENQVRVVVPHLGGGFGAKCELGFEPQLAALARASRRPVRMVFDRREEFLLPDHRRERMIVSLETGVSEEGAIVARKVHLLIDNGAYSMDEPGLGQLAGMLSAGPYRIPHLEVQVDVVYTTTQPSGSVRAPTAPTVCWAVEQHHDVIAQRLALDPIEFRRRNLVRTGDLGPTGQRYEQAAALETLDRAVELMGPVADLPPGQGIGFACGMWPSFPAASGAFVMIHADGSGVIITGAQECGSGAVMALPLLAAEVLGMAPDDFRVVYQDTDAGPYDPGSSGSQTTLNNGRAVAAAAQEVREQLLDLAAEALEARRDDLVIVDGSIYVRGTPHISVTIRQLAAEAGSSGLLIGRGSGHPGALPAVDATRCTGRLGLESLASPSFFAHAAKVAVDTSTGIVRVLRVVAVHEAGRILNPSGAEGQVCGGVVMGIGQALTESIRLSEEGTQLNPSLLTYKLPTAADVPAVTVDLLELPASADLPVTLKGLGEPPCIPTPGAIANAIAAAIGVRIHHLPMSPEHVWSALAESGRGAAR